MNVCVSNLDATTSDRAIRFDYEGKRFRVSCNECVEEVKDGFLSGNESAHNVEQLLFKGEK
jgi:hypothetical protein